MNAQLKTDTKAIWKKGIYFVYCIKKEKKAFDGFQLPEVNSLEFPRNPFYVDLPLFTKLISNSISRLLLLLLSSNTYLKLLTPRRIYFLGILLLLLLTLAVFLILFSLIPGIWLARKAMQARQAAEQA